MLMILTLVAIGPVFMLLIFSELLWRLRLLRGEAARKLLHIIIGSYVACWAFFLPSEHIELLSVALFVGAAISHRFKIFHAIIDIKRRSWGDLFYAAGIGIAALVSNSPWIFAVAILHMSIADGLAGLVGSSLGKDSGYKVIGQKKSLAGTAAFFVSSVAILFAIAPGPMHLTLGWHGLLIPVVATLAENFGVYGSDNITVPLLLTVWLNALV